MEHAQLKDIENQIIRSLAGLQSRLTVGKAEFAAIDAALGEMQLEYGTWASDVNAFAAANPSNADAVALKASRDLLVAQFSAARAEAQALDAAVNS